MPHIDLPATGLQRDNFPVPLLMRQALAQAIQTVFASVYPNHGLGRCATYAIVGAQVLSQVLAHPYHAVAGGQVMDCGEGMFVVLYPSQEQRQHAQSLSDTTEYHCWIQSYRHTDLLAAPRLEVVDFTARHDGLSAALFGVPYNRPRPPDFLWDWADVLNESFPQSLREHPDMAAYARQWMWLDPHFTNLLQQMGETEPEYYAQLTAAVITTLQQQTELRMAAMRRVLASSNPYAPKATALLPVAPVQPLSAALVSSS